MPKPIPPATIEELFPPDNNYQYFENCQDHPFRYQSNKFQMVNAWWLADASLLSYGESNFVESKFDNAGLATQSFSGQSTQCYVAHDNNFVIVAFRGTQVNAFQDIVRDIYTNAKFHLVDSEQGGFVHQGFKEGLNEIWSNLLNHLNRLKAEKPERTFWFTGHSLGAALATLAADRYGSVRGLYTFGSPRVGDRDFKSDFYVNTYRFVNNNDLVTRIPPEILLPQIPIPGVFLPQIILPRSYQHVGQLKYINSDGHIIDNPSQWDRLIDDWRGNFGHLVNLTGRLRDGWIGEIPIDHLTDHAPIYYAIRIWNNYEQDLITN